MATKRFFLRNLVGAVEDYFVKPISKLNRCVLFHPTWLCRCVLFVFFPLVVAPCLYAEFTIHSRLIGRQSYVYLEDISNYYNMRLAARRKDIVLRSDNAHINLVLGSRKASINSVASHLSFVPLFDSDQILVSELDFLLLLDPILRGSGLPDHDVKRIVVDPGHGGKDKGAEGSRYLEKDLNLLLSKQLQRLLQDNGFSVMLTRNSDSYISLSHRGKIAKRWKADLFISIHCNAAHNKKVTGIETFIVTPRGAPSTAKSSIYSKAVSGNEFDSLNTRVGYEIQQQLLDVTGARDRGLKYYRWQVLCEASCPAVLIETGFLSNAGEERKLGNPAYQNQIVTGIANGIISFHNLVSTK